MTPWRLARYFLHWQQRRGDLLLVVSLALAVAAVTAVDYFASRVEMALSMQGGELLAADIALELTEAPPDTLLGQARALGLETAVTLSFPSVVADASRPQLVEVKAVSPGYPLRGTLRTRERPDGAEAIAPRGPSPGQVWVEPRLLVLLAKQIGDRIQLGEANFVISRLLTYEPDRGGNLFQLAPRVMLALADIPATGLVNDASRVRYRLLVAGAPQPLDKFRRWLKSRQPPGARLLDAHNARPELRTALDRGRRFLGLASLTTVLLSGAAIALAMRRQITLLSDAVAVLRCLGASRRLIVTAFFLRLLALGALASGLGCLLGLAAQSAFGYLLQDWFSSGLPWPGLRPLVTGLLTGLVMLLGFSLPPLLRLQRVSPLRVIRRDLGEAPPAFWLLVGVALFAMAALIFWQAADAALAIRVLAGFAAGLAAFLGAAFFLIQGLRPLQHRLHGLWRHACASLTRYPGFTSIQLAAFATGITALLLLAIVRVDLLDLWSRSLPERAPNRFLINIQPDQVAPLEEFLGASAVGRPPLFPMIRGRLVSINEHAVEPDSYPGERARRLAAREFNLSWSEHLPSDNQIVAGSWWGANRDAPPQFSVEQGLAQILGIRIGDRLSFLVAGQQISAPVTSLRAVKWDSFRVNFFVVGTPDLLHQLPAAYITAFYLPADQELTMRQLIGRFPNVTLLDVSAILRHLRGVIDRGVLAVQYVFLFTLAAGTLVLFAGIQSHLETRVHEAAILRTLGARRRQLLAAAGAEFALLGLLAGLLAAASATATGYLVSHQLLDLDYRINPWVWLAGALGGAVGIGLAGLAATYPLLRRPPVQALRLG